METWPRPSTWSVSQLKLTRPAAVPVVAQMSFAPAGMPDVSLVVTAMTGP
jgi:hypothetical protein